MTELLKSSLTRRNVLQAAAVGAVGISPALRAVVYAQGSDAPEKKEVKIGFIPLTDCASVVMASVLGIDKKYGVTIIPTKEASWAGVRDKLVSGELDMAHSLYGLIYGVHLGTSGPKKDMAVLMTLNQNGQAITLSKKLADKGAVDAASLAKVMAAEKREYTYAQTFPTGTHAMWLYYWLASVGVNPMKDVKVITVPPPQMVANMRVGNMDGYCVGEPWGHRAIADGIGITAVTTQDIWKDHPEKVLGTTADFVKKNPNTARAVTAAIIEAGKWIDASLGNKNKMAETVADKSYVNTSVDVINQRILGRYQNGLGKTWDDPNHMKFYNDGAVSFPYLSDGMWFLTQHKRWGLLKEHPDYLAVAKQINQIDIYKQAATAAKAHVPKEVMRSSKMIDGVVWDGKDPQKYADGFKIKV
ncbi:MAG: ABC transporter substrate-binding protein [Polaromonas sp.]|uniref:CmpA/NrtA family ABC transporter substrate-binding protein n=1 Tax=Polaromonas sp. TaxID=1869339 RepID=UPI0017B2A1AE|nr:CmpA/NrtA family ABC transporter substrate-binding protein [Polaromonas sp.]MBA3594002.1 ABC transporter substrate-binding protein [Polaromonas sp.]